MKFAIMSDVHSNPRAFEAAIEDSNGFGITDKKQRILLGDIVGYGYDPLRCLEIADANFSTILKGNHEAGLIGELGLDWFSKHSADSIVSQRRFINDEWRKWIGNLPFRVSNTSGHFLAAHGSYDAAEEFNYIDNPVDIAMEFAMLRAGTEKSCRFNVDFVGHTHLRMAIEMSSGCDKMENRHEDVITVQPDRYYIFNVGSVGYPRTDRFISYVIYDTDSCEVTYRKLPFDFKDYAARLEANEIPIPIWLDDELERIEKKEKEDK